MDRICEGSSHGMAFVKKKKNNSHRDEVKSFEIITCLGYILQAKPGVGVPIKGHCSFLIQVISQTVYYASTRDTNTNDML